MNKLINFGKLTIKGTPVGLFSGATDAGTMYALGKFTNIDLDYRVYISSGLGMTVSFIGNYLWTFKHGTNPSSKKVKAIKFIINHLILTYIHAELVIFTINHINKLIEGNTTTNIFTKKDKDDKVSLTNVSEIIVKQILAGLFYVINIFIMQYIF